MNSFPPAVRRFGYTAMEARATRTRRLLERPVASRRRISLWLPLTPLFAILAPFAVLLSLLGYLVPPRWRPDPLMAVIAIGAVLLSLSGTDVDVDTPDARVRLRIF